MLQETDDAVDELLDAVPRLHPESLDDDMTHLVGTPAEVADDIARFQGLGVEEIAVGFIHFPRTSGAELLVDEVLPAL